MAGLIHGLERSTFFELTEIYARGIRWARKNAELNGPDEAAAFLHFKSELVSNMRRELLGVGYSGSEADAILQRISDPTALSHIGHAGNA